MTALATCQCCQPASLASILLTDIQAVAPVGSFVPTDELVASLIEHNPSQWSEANHYGRDLTPQRMGRLLANELGIRSTRNHKDKRGYCVSVFASVAA
jgi:hypothetical protein